MSRTSPRRQVMRRRFRGGGALLELALCMVLLMNLCYGSIEFGYYFWVKSVMDSAAREGARAAIDPSHTNAKVTTAVNAVLTADNFTTSNFTVTTSPADVSTATFGSQITVTITGNWGTLGAGFSPLHLMGTGKTITASGVMYSE